MLPSSSCYGLVAVAAWLALGMLLVDAQTSRAQPTPEQIVLDDFEQDTPGQYPTQWLFFNSRENRYVSLDRHMRSDETFIVQEENGNRYLQGYTSDEAQRITVGNDEDFDLDWSLESHPQLRWRWRAHHLPVGASEDDVNDAGAAIYVTFDTDWLGRPKSIKYTYSSTLPAGTVVRSTRRLKVIVAASAQDGIDRWVRLNRDVVADYKDVFGGTPPNKPLSITLWSDSDTTSDSARVDIDDIVLMPPATP